MNRPIHSPPLPTSRLLAGFTMASTCCCVISPHVSSILRISRGLLMSTTWMLLNLRPSTVEHHTKLRPSARVRANPRRPSHPIASPTRHPTSPARAASWLAKCSTAWKDPRRNEPSRRL